MNTKISLSLLKAFMLAATAPLLVGCAIVAKTELTAIAVAGAPKAAGPYSQGIVANVLLFTAGMVARDPVSNLMVQGDITAQTQQVFNNLAAILKGAGASFKEVVKVNVYMTDLGDFAKMNDVMASKFGEHKPARTTIQAAKLPAGATIEIDFIVRIP